jgi:potassium-transporting ATPase KdpC subunit
MKKMNVDKHLRQLSPAVRLAALSLILCGLIFPLLVTGLAQGIFPSQANGSITSIGGRHVGSSLIAQSFNQPFFFHPRPSNSSASGVDPDITLQDALSQIPRISSATGIPGDQLQRIVNDNVQRTFWFIGDPFVNVLQLNQNLISTYPFYQAYG